MLTAFLAMFGGIAFIFIGVRISGANLKQAIGPGMRRWMVRLTRTQAGGALAGFVLGAITQSANGAAFIATSLAAAGVIGVAEAMPVAAWASVGVTIKIVLATLDVHPLVLVAMIASGIGYYLNLHQVDRWRPYLGILFGLALLFFGVHETKVAGTALSQFEATKTFVALSRHYFVLSVPIGFVLGLVLHNSTTAAVIAIALGSAGLFGVEETVVISMAASIGAALAGLIEFSAFRGRMRQVAFAYVTSKVAGPVLLLPVVLVEHWSGWPMLLALFGAREGHYATVVIAVYAVTQLAGAVFVTAFIGPLRRIFLRLAPPDTNDTFGRPKHLDEAALGQPDLALALARREQKRLLRFLRLYLASPDASINDRKVPTRDALRTATRNLTEEIDGYLRRIAANDPGPAGLAEIARRSRTNELIDGMHDAMHALAIHLEQATHPALENVRVTLREGVDAMLVASFELLEHGPRMDRAAFRRLTADRSGLMERIRQRTLTDSANVSAEIYATLFAMTSAAEHLVWLLARYGVLASRTPRLTLGRLAA